MTEQFEQQGEHTLNGFNSWGIILRHACKSLFTCGNERFVLTYFDKHSDFNWVE